MRVYHEARHSASLQVIIKVKYCEIRIQSKRSVGLSFRFEDRNQLLRRDKPIGVESVDDARHDAHLTDRCQDVEVKVCDRAERGPVETEPDITEVCYVVLLEDLLPCLDQPLHQRHVFLAEGFTVPYMFGWDDQVVVGSSRFDVSET